jgi:hypothetical protein
MKSTIAIATFLVAGASAAGVGAIVKPYYGTDSQWPAAAIQAAAITPSNAYAASGSDVGQGAMTGDFVSHPATQQTAPMSRMMNDFNRLCDFEGGTFGSKLTHASGIVLALDAVEIVASAQSGAAPACNGTADNTGAGLAYSGSSVFVDPKQNWRYVLALVYGGLDISTGITDCDQPARHALVQNWSNLFQNGCANPVAQCSPTTGFAKGALWHAFRPDDASAISDIFASAIGLVGSPLVSAVNGFGATPYCNAINWDTSSANGTTCLLGANKQWVGPGGILDPVANDGLHRRPPKGTWGDNPDPGQGSFGADVLATQFQDNDPIRRPCLGGATNVHVRAGEEVCNLDGALGLVLPIPSSDFLFDINDPNTGSPLKQYPTNSCNTFAVGKPTTVFTCAPRGTRHSGECPNGDALIAGACLVPVDTVNNTSQCVATKATVAALQSRNLGNPDGRIYNVQMRDGTMTEPTIGYAQYPIPALGRTFDFVGGFSRIHEVETMLGGIVAGCQYVSMTDQIACLTQADPCSIGLTGHGATTFAKRAAPGQTPGAIGDLRVDQIAPATTSIQQVGQAGAYPLTHKVYFNSVVGFANIGPNNLDELTLAKFLANPANTNPIFVGAFGMYSLGPRSPTGMDTPFCEDFNEQLYCGAPSNADGCAGNPAGITTVSTVCGDNMVDAFEECDLGVNNGVPRSNLPFCSVDCRSVPTPSCPTGTVYCRGTNMCVSGACPP